MFMVGFLQQNDSSAKSRARGNLVFQQNWPISDRCLAEELAVSARHEPCNFSCNHTLISDW
jgi:hypothetical protein